MVTKEKPKTGMYENVQNQFNKAADLMKLNPNVRKILSITNTEDCGKLSGKNGQW